MTTYKVEALHEAIARYRMEPPPGCNAPERVMHDQLCRCTECHESRHERRGALCVVPFQPSSEQHRNEPVATLKFGSVTIELTLSLVHSLWQNIERRNASLATFCDALNEVESRMWDSLDTKTVVR